MDSAVLISAEVMLTRTQLPEVFGSLRNHIVVEMKFYPTAFV